MLITSVTLTACTSVEPSTAIGGHIISYSPVQDQVGNYYPWECLDVSEIHVPISYIDFKNEDKPVTINGKEYPVTHLGMTEWGAGEKVEPHIYLNIKFKTDPAFRKKFNEADTIHHEKCHVKMFFLTGDGRWHG